jgi:D-alanyl-lipoteichoic acid acyltransferase DltB (MBOAT superfamily)
LTHARERDEPRARAGPCWATYLIFNSLAFFAFFPIVVALTFAFPERLRWVVLLAASWLFYAWWRVEYLGLLLVSTTVDYTVGRLLGVEERPGRRKLLLAASLVVNLGMLFFFKYLRFFSVTARALTGAEIPLYDLVLPVGISFYTFQTIGYGIDVYRRKYEPERHFGRFALFVAFFPHLVAGPIMRAQGLLPQFRRIASCDFDRTVSGLGWMLWGLFKKVVIADRAAAFVNVVYGAPDRFQGSTIVVATYLFAFQIYCDFSGYSDIALGAARVLGVDLMRNFDRPYASSTMVDFWRRWHISLSTWFVDYVYVPLGGNRVSWSRRAANVAIVFLLSGLWHGASWTFVLWGAYHGALVVASLGLGYVAKRLLPSFARGAPAAVARALGVAVTFQFVAFGWLLFRAKDLDHVRALLARFPISYPVSTLHEVTHMGPAPAAALGVDLVVLVASIVVMEVGELAITSSKRERIPRAVRWAAWATLSVWVVLTAVQTHSTFLYFQF